MNNTLLIMPAFNEESNIAAILDEVLALNLPMDILVINDGSEDQTEKIVTSKHVQVLDLLFNSGYGVACQTGFKYGELMGYDYLIQMDSDGQHLASNLPSLYKTIVENDVDMVIGSRFLSAEGYPIGLFKKFAIGLFKIMIKCFTHQIITDPSSGLQALNRKAFSFYAKIDQYPGDYPDADVLIRMLLEGFKIVEIPAVFKTREHGKSMHSGLKPIFYMFKMFISILMVVLRHKLRERRAKLWR